MNIVLTNAGLQKIINAEQTGTAPVVISQIAFGSGRYTANASQIALQNEIKRLSVISGGTDNDHAIHVAAQDTSSDAYSVYEFGLFLSDGTLFAVYSQTETPILQKSISSVAQFECGITLQGVNVESISFGDVSFSYPYASDTNAGIAEIATAAEAQAGTDNTRILTPAGLQQVTATTERKGVAEIATTAEAQAGTDNTRIITPANLQQVTATETRKGIVELATNAEAQAGTDNTRALTPAALQAVTATESRNGIVELATTAEAQGGTTSHRWKAVYAVNGTIQTSDENLKEEIGEIPEAVFKAWANVKFVQYKFKDAVKEKGEKARYHIGLIAQRIVAAFKAEGLDAFAYGLVCRDALKDGGEILSLRYDECLALECAYERNRFDKILIKLKGGDN